jgi:hypothetical protein
MAARRREETMQSLAWQADDIVKQLGMPPNASGILRRVYDSEFYRPAPVGAAPDLLSRAELSGWIARWKAELHAAKMKKERELDRLYGPRHPGGMREESGMRRQRSEDTVTFKDIQLAKKLGSLT